MLARRHKAYTQNPKGKQTLSRIKKDTTALVKKMMPDLLLTDENCAISLLDLEIGVFRDSPQNLGALYLARQEWPLSKALARLFWNVSEKLWEADKKQTARDLWRFIIEKAPSDAPETTFAKLRLDNTKHEYDKLWR